MRNLFSVIKNELIRYFISPLAYTYLIAFLVLNACFTIYLGNFFGLGRADLSAMFNYQPWIYLLFIPGISMRLWSEEFRTKTIVQIMSMPISTSVLVWGKFLASWIFCGLALFLTGTFWITVNVLGSPDNNVIALGYFGSFILAGCMLAISQTMSALTKNQVTALVLSILANLLFMFSGLEYVLALFRMFAPDYIVDMIASFSFVSHFYTISNGLLELRDIIFFASILLLFNFTSIIIISFRTTGTSVLLKANSRAYYIIMFILFLSGFVGMNLLANNYTRACQYDFTAEKIFSLTPSTHKVLTDLKEPVIVKLYYSPELGIRNPQYRLLFDKVRLLLQQYQILSNNKLTYNIYNPEPFDNYEDRAVNQGLKGIPLVDLNQFAYFGLTISNSIDQYSNIPFFALERENLLEQDLTSALYRLNHVKQDIGIISTLPIFDNVVANVATSEWAFMKSLRQLYNLHTIKNAEQISTNLKALIIIHPRDLSQEMINAIRNYSMHGGKILLFADIATDASKLYAPITEAFKSSDLNGLDYDWGFKFHQDLAIADLDNSLTVNSDIKVPEYTQDLLQFYLSYNEINHFAPETSLLKKFLLSSSSIISPEPGAAVEFIPLLFSSNNSAAISARYAQENFSNGYLLSNFKKDKYTKVIAAHIISKDSSRPFDVIAVADTDILYDKFWAHTITLPDENLIIPIFDNINFLLNSLETLIGGDNLISLRGKSAKLRNFEHIEKLRRHAQYQFKVNEYAIYNNIDKTKQGLKEIWGKKNFEGRENFTPDELAIITKIRQKLDQQRLELRQIRSALHDDINRYDFWIKFLNIYAVSLLILLCLLIKNLKDYKFNCYQIHKGSAIYNRQFIYTATVSLILLLSGIISVYLSNISYINQYENKPLLPELAQQINQVQQVILSSHNRQLHFFKKDGIWQLQEQPHFAVMQDRMRSFLSALLEARFYEKKSDLAENLPYFGLQPISVADSPSINIELKNEQGQNLQTLEIGKYNIALGRGTNAAYIKFPEQFQVWLVAIELVDLSTDYSDWTFNKLWDLRFGRFLSFNHITDINHLADLAKYMLNTKLNSVATDLNSYGNLFNIDLQVEGNEKINLSFLQKDDKYFVQYHFNTSPKNTFLALFAKTVQGHFYEVNKSDLDKIKNVVTAKISKPQTN